MSRLICETCKHARASDDMSPVYCGLPKSAGGCNYEEDEEVRDKAEEDQ